MAKPRLLLLADHMPQADGGRRAARSFALLTHLKQRFSIALCVLMKEADDAQQGEALLPFCADAMFVKPQRQRGAGGPLLRPRAIILRHRRFLAWLDEKRQRHGPLAVEVACGNLTAPVLALARRRGDVPLFVDLATPASCQLTYDSRRGGPVGQWRGRRGQQKMAALEATITRRATGTFVSSPEEAAALRQHPGTRVLQVAWFRDGVDLNRWRADARFERVLPGPDLVLLSAAVPAPEAHFFKKCWPVLKAAHPSLTMMVIGARAPANSPPGVTYLAASADPRPHFAAAKLGLVLGAGSGAVGPVLPLAHAMAMGTPMVTPLAVAHSLGAQDGAQLRTADSAAEIVFTVDALLAAPEAAERIGAAGAAFVHAHGGWDSVLSRFDARLASDVPHRRWPVAAAQTPRRGARNLTKF